MNGNQSTPTDADRLAVWDAWSRRSLYAHVLDDARARGNAEAVEVMTRALDTMPEVDPLDALAANHELATALRRQQWHAVLAAREAGATWEQIADATDATYADDTRAAFLARIERAETYAPGYTDTDRYRAAL